MNVKQIVLVMVFIVIGIILAIYLSDMFICIYTDSPLPLAELATFLVLFIGTLIFTVVFRKDLRSLMQKQKSKTKFLNKANMHFSHNKVRKGFFMGDITQGQSRRS